MAAISAAMVKELRDRSGQAMMDCKKALAETDGDMDKAVELLRKKGAAVMEKRGERETNEGKVLGKISDDGKTAAMVMLCCETDFTAKNDEFVAATQAVCDALLASGDTPADAAALGALDAGGKTVDSIVNDMVSKTGEKMTIGDFAKYQLAGDGLIFSYVHFNDKMGTLIQLDSDSADAASSEDLKTLASDLAMHITANNPQATTRDDVDAELVAKERDIAKEQVKGKPENIIDKIVDGKLNKWFGEIVLLEQPFVKDDSKTVTQLIDEVGKKVGAKVSLNRFARMQIG